MKKQRKPLKNFPKAIGFVHWGVAICVIGAIISSLFVDISDPDSDLSIIIHVRIGYGVAFFLLCQWFLLSFKRYKPVREHVFPYHLEGRKCIAADLHLLMQGKLPPTGCRSGASGLVEGLGILLLTWMALTGLIFHFGAVYGVDKTSLMLLIRNIHNFFSFFVWVFVIGHGGMAVVHRIIDRSSRKLP
jgi:cytochrome b561